MGNVATYENKIANYEHQLRHLYNTGRLTDGELRAGPAPARCPARAAPSGRV